MSAERSQRPAGVTVLAIIYIVGFAIGLLFLLGGIYDFLANGTGTSQTYPTATTFYVTEGLHGLLCILLIASGIGLLGCRRFLGRYIGSVVFLASLAKSIALVQLMPKEFGLFTLALVVWPLITAILVNTVFRDDLTR